MSDTQNTSTDTAAWDDALVARCPHEPQCDDDPDAGLDFFPPPEPPDRDSFSHAAWRLDALIRQYAAQVPRCEYLSRVGVGIDQLSPWTDGCARAQIIIALDSVEGLSHLRHSLHYWRETIFADPCHEGALAWREKARADIARNAGELADKIEEDRRAA